MTALLSVKNLSKCYSQHSSFFRRKMQTAFAPTSFELERGKTLAVVGESGSGKSTLAKALAGVITPTTGTIYVNGEQMRDGDHAQRCRLIRMIFQDPNTSLNPRSRIGRILESPLALNTDLTDEQRQQKVEDALRQVGLLPDHAYYYPQMISSGQKQKVALARAMILEPKILVADEVLAALDVSVRSQIVNLLLKLQQERQIGFIFVAHNLGMVKHISDNVMVMHEGVVVEHGETQEIFNNPQHDITKRLLQSHFTQFKK